ncbi:MAG: hypothetical protein CVT95_03930, partial [Bacteroidetes bacterium HGW-Bacteroidetes-12]
MIILINNKYFLFLMFILKSFLLFSQMNSKIDTHLVNFRIYSNENNFESALQSFDSITDKKKLSQWDYLSAAQNAAKINAIDNVKKYLESAILLGLDSVDIAEDTLFRIAWINLRPNYKILRKDYYNTSSFDIDLMMKINEIHSEDQSIRKYWMIYRN